MRHDMTVVVTKRKTTECSLDLHSPTIHGYATLALALSLGFHVHDVREDEDDLFQPVNRIVWFHRFGSAIRQIILPTATLKHKLGRHEYHRAEKRLSGIKELVDRVS